MPFIYTVRIIIVQVQLNNVINLTLSFKGRITWKSVNLFEQAQALS